MPTWQFDGTVSYLSGKRVAHTSVFLGVGDPAKPATVFRTDTDLSGRFQSMWREAPSDAAGGWVRVYDGWKGKWSDWTLLARQGSALSADIVLNWDQPDVCALNGQWHAISAPFTDGLISLLEQRKPLQHAQAVRLLPLTERGVVNEAYPRDNAMERMLTQFLDEVSQARSPHAAIDIARRISDCLLRMGLAKRFDERVDVFRFVLHSLHARPHEDRKTHLRSLLKTLSMSLRRPFVPGNGAVIDLEVSTALMAIVLFAAAHLSLGRTDLRLSKEAPATGRMSLLITVP